MAKVWLRLLLWALRAVEWLVGALVARFVRVSGREGEVATELHEDGLITADQLEQVNRGERGVVDVAREASKGADLKVVRRPKQGNGP